MVGQECGDRTLPGRDGIAKRVADVYLLDYIGLRTVGFTSKGESFRDMGVTMYRDGICYAGIG